MSVVLITGAAGLIGSEAALFFSGKGFDIVGVDNDLALFLWRGSRTSWHLAHGRGKFIADDRTRGGFTTR